MAELSALPPSPPALSEPLPPAPTAAALHPKMDPPTNPAPPIPKSSLYANKAPVANALPSPSKTPSENPAPSSGQAPPPGKEVQQQPGNHVTAGITNAHNPPSPPETAPSLYPSVHVTQSSANTDVSKEQPQIVPLSDSKLVQQEASQAFQQITREVTQDVTQEVTQDLTKEVTQDLTKEVTQDLTKEATQDLTKEVTQDLTKEVTQDLTKEVTQDLTQEVTQDLTKEATQDLTKEVTQDLTKEVTQDLTKEVTQDLTQEATQDLTKEATQDLTKEVTQEVTRDLTKEVTQEVTQRLTEEDAQKVTQTSPPEVAPESDLPPNPPPPKQDGSPGPSVPLINEPAGADWTPTAPPVAQTHPAPDTLSYLESASLMSGTLESLSGLGDDGSSVGSDSEVNGLAVRRTDKYGFLGGSQYSETGEKDMRVEVSRQREMKWLDMFNHWDKWVKHRFQKVKMRCRKGVPSSLRARAWQLLSNSHDLLLANPGKFEELEREQGEAKWLDIIEKDLHRQFPFHEMFAARGGHGQQDLYRILKAYTVYRPDEGYCQAQAPVAAVLLMHMPAEQAFWCLVQICEKYLPGYYSAGLEAIQLDGEIFFSLLRRTCPMAYRHLKKFKIDPILYMTEWFMCIFSRTLPWASVLRVWDMFFCEGVKIVFRVGLVLLKQMLGSVDKLREVQGMYETMERLRNITPDLIREDVLVQEIVTLPVTEALIERECGVQVRKWRESRGELTHQPGRRLHGTRHVYEHKRRASALASGGSFSFLGSPVPPPGPLRASSSLLSLPGFRRSKAPFFSQPKKSSFSGPSRADSPPQSPPAAATKPPIPPQSPLVTNESAQRPDAPKPPPSAAPPQPSTLSPSPKIVSEQITPKIPSPTANNAPLPPCEARKPPENPPPEEEEGGKKAAKKSKEEKRKDKEDERRRLKEKRDREKAEKERAKKEKERQEREKKRSARKKQHAGAAAAAEEKEKQG